MALVDAADYGVGGRRKRPAVVREKLSRLQVVGVSVGP
jgi:hypothetical protein